MLSPSHEEDLEEAVDPRVQIELENLNSATDEINKLEVDLDDARAAFRHLLMESTRRIDELSKKLGTCIERARPYYEARLKAKEALQETQVAAVRFERANSAHSAAKEMVFLAEEGLKTEGRTFDHAWQEMLNHATMRVNESERERTLGEVEHRRTSLRYQEAEQRVHHLQKELKRAIAKSSLVARRSFMQMQSLAYQHQLHLLPYFEMKSQANIALESQKARVRVLEKQVAQSKMCYSKALGNLEKISDEIHQTRRASQCNEERGTGVGAESSQPPTPARKAIKPAPVAIAERQPPRQQGPHQVQTDEFLGLPASLGPAASPMMQPISSEEADLLEKLVMESANKNNKQAPGPVIVNNNGSSSERVRDLLNQGMMMLNISSINLGTPNSSTQGTPSRRRSSSSRPCSKVPSPLEKSLLYLGDEDSASDSESLASVEMLSDEQIASLMLEDLDEDPLLGLPVGQTIQASSRPPSALSKAA